MPKQQEILKKLLQNEFGINKIQKPNYSDFSNSKFHNEIENTYKKLNGQLEIYPIGFKGFDIQITNCIVELDEAQHFNSYRSLTLDSTIYKTNNSFSTSDYKKYCKEYEYDCLQKGNFGQYWKTNSTEKQFGISSPEGILTGNGSSRWRQRAFYDFLRDVGQYVGGYKLTRISIYQRIEDKTIGEILERGLIKYYPLLLKQIE